MGIENELRDFHGRWSVGNSGGSDKGKTANVVAALSHEADKRNGEKTEVLLGILRTSSKEHPRRGLDIPKAIKDRNGSLGPFADKYEVGRQLADLTKQGVIKSKYDRSNKTWGYYLPSKPKAAGPKAPTKAAAKTVASKAPTKVATPTQADTQKTFHLATWAGSPATIRGGSIEQAVREHFGNDAEIRDISGEKFVFKNGRVVTRIKRPGESAAYMKPYEPKRYK